MADRSLPNKMNRNNTNIISTKKIFKANKRSDHTLKPDAQNRNIATTSNFTLALDQPFRSSNKDHTTNNNNTSPNQPSNHHQNFSSRNSLRTAQFIANGTNIPQLITNKPRKESSTMHELLDPIMDAEIMLDRNIDDVSNYDNLTGEHFLRIMGDYIICMLCGKRERMSGRSGVDAYDKHLASELHNNQLIKLRSDLFNQIPSDSSLQMNIVRELLNTWYTKIRIHDDYHNYYSIVEELGFVLHSIDPECCFRIIGSLLDGTANRTSDINLELIHPNSALFEKDPRGKNSIHHQLVDPDADYGRQINKHTLHYDLAPNAIDTLYKLMCTINNKYEGSHAESFSVISDLNDLNGKIPKLMLNYRNLIKVEVSCYTESSHRLGLFLQKYLSLDYRAQVLSMLVKHWARICEINNPNQGTYPPDAFIILVIYFLQRTSLPVLPCLHDMIGKSPRMSETKSDGVQMAQSRKVEIDRKLYSSSINDNNLVDGTFKTLDSQDSSLDNGIETGEEEIDDEEDDDIKSMDLDNEAIINANWTSTNTTPVHKLFVEFFKFMVEEFDNMPNVITIRTLSKVTLPRKGWGSQVKAIENPIKPMINFSRCIGTVRTFEYIKMCFKHAFYYLLSMPLISKNGRFVGKDENQSDPRDFIELFVNLRRLDYYYRMKEASIRARIDYNPIPEMIQQGLFARDVVVIDDLFRLYEFKVDTLPKSVANFYNEKLLKPQDFTATKFCWLCRKQGHSRKKCPKSRLERLDEELHFYDLELDLSADFDASFIDFYERDKITPRLHKDHRMVLEELNHIINSSTKLECSLKLFGSTVNNLGSYDSDLDICMTLKGNLTGKGVDCVSILNEVYNVLLDVKKVRSLERILTARVPILKFRYETSNRSFEVDLSMYNQCASYNSKLLRTYSLLDKRVPQLIYLVKRYAKVCGIADASRGSLSSYAWSILVIHFLQHSEPPILPVLQETDRKSPTKQTIGVNGWNVWFNEDLKSIPQTENASTLTTLFKKFLIYYSSFNFSYQVVSIRKSFPITKFQKNWHNCMMAIEDPFELTYNLASRLDDPMAIYVINSFAQAFRHIVRIQNSYLELEPRSNLSQAQKIFKGKDITDSNPPYRGCRVCHKIGHKIRDCPEKNRTRGYHNNNQRAFV